MRIRSAVPLLALAGALWLSTGGAAAQQHGMGACRDDVKRLCGDDQYNREGIAACLDKHASELSPACAQRYTAMKERRDAFKKACGTDVAKVCPGADQGQKTFRCLHDHESSLSQPCKDALAKARENFMQRQKGKSGDSADKT